MGRGPGKLDKMSKLETVEPFIGAQLTHARRVLVTEDNQEFCLGMELIFATGCLGIYAVPDDDSLKLERRALAVANDLAPMQGHYFADAKILSRFHGQVLCNAWLCFSGEGYCDAIDFGFGDLNLPNAKILSMSSEVIELSINS